VSRPRVGFGRFRGQETYLRPCVDRATCNAPAEGIGLKSISPRSILYKIAVSRWIDAEFARGQFGCRFAAHLETTRGSEAGLGLKCDCH
jgi:hypothetical protein